PERRALRPAERGAGDRVDFLDRVLPGLEDAKYLHHAEQPNMVGDEIRSVLRDDDALAEAVIGEIGHLVNDCRIGVGGANDLEEPKVSRRVEEVRAEPVLAEVRAAPLREGGNGDA